MEPLKFLYSESFLKSLAAGIKGQCKSFDNKAFLSAVTSGNWSELELTQRTRQVSTELGKFLPGDFASQVGIICRLATQLRKDGVPGGFPWICLADFVEVYGTDDPETSLEAMAVITKFISCEFAVRTFLLTDPVGVMKKMKKWSRDENANLRRFSSEGCRPRLPWGRAIPAFKKDPTPIIPILENLIDDESEFVRKSVANNLNDIAKDNPGIVVAFVKKWKGHSKNADWILKHGSRTLLKKASPEIYSLFGLSGKHHCEVTSLKLARKTVPLAGTLDLSFSIINRAKKPEPCRVEMAVYYVRPTEKHSRKLFKITETILQPGVEYDFKRKLDFKDLTTRKHFAGKHKLAIVVNGVEAKQAEFKVL